MKKETLTEATNTAYEDMLKCQEAIDCCEPNSLLRPIYRILYHLSWIAYQILLEIRRKPNE